MAHIITAEDERIFREFQRRHGWMGLVHPRTAIAVIADDFAEGRLDSHGVYVMRNALIGPVKLPLQRCAECCPWLAPGYDHSAPLFAISR